MLIRSVGFIEYYIGQYKSSKEDLHLVAEAEKDDSGVEHLEGHDSDDGPQDASLASRHRGPADDSGGDDVHEGVLAELEGGGGRDEDRHDAADRGRHAREHEGGEEVAVGIDAREPGRGAVAADETANLQDEARGICA